MLQPRHTWRYRKSPSVFQRGTWRYSEVSQCSCDATCGVTVKSVSVPATPHMMLVKSVSVQRRHTWRYSVSATPNQPVFQRRHKWHFTAMPQQAFRQRQQRFSQTALPRRDKRRDSYATALQGKAPDKVTAARPQTVPTADIKRITCPNNLRQQHSAASLHR